jgi:hypothetical protein
MKPRAFGAVVIVAGAAALVAMWGSQDQAPLGSAVPVPAQQTARVEPIEVAPEEPRHAPAIPEKPSVQPATARDWSAFPTTQLSPKQEAEAREFWACIKAVRKLRPITGGTDAEQLAGIQRERDWDAWAVRLEEADAKINGREPQAPPPDLIDPGVECPPERLRREYEERRQEDLRKR